VRTMTVAQDEGVRGIQSELNELEEEKARLLARHHALSHVRARSLDPRIPLPVEVTDVTPAAATREMAEIERQVADLVRRIDAAQGQLILADVKAQASIAEAATPEYVRLVAARDRAKAVLDERERDIQTFLTDLRRRGVFQTPRIAEKA
jgi:hypothetical protein